ncbi:MAG: hypothetical protein PHG66_03830 [Candidatus Colwellbacteria bacterium]|nr:hypothetical protein [Candidatus Colwellbacteria bacterium]
MNIINFPVEEESDIRLRISKGKKVFSVRVSREYGRYKKGDELRTEWGDKLLVSDVIKISGGVEELREKYVFFRELNERMLSEIKPYKEMDILTLSPTA